MVLLTDWQRLEKVIKWTGHAINAFAREIGLNRAENLYQIKNGNNRISRNLADIIVDKYPQINKGWLLTSVGSMFVVDDGLGVSVPFYDVDAEKYVSHPNSFSSHSRIILPIQGDADFATMYHGRAMGEEIPAGSIVVFKRVSPQNFVPGGNYLVVTSDFVMLRRLRRNVESELVRLLPVDNENFDEIRITEQQILDLFFVKIVIINKSV
jgi:hypothetical protein